VPTPTHTPISTAVDQFKLFDLAVREWLVGMGPHLNGQVYHVVFATPDRAFATLNQIYEKKLGERADRVKIAPTPLASISRSTHRMDRDRLTPKLALLRGQRYTADKRLNYDARWPLPWDMSYQIDFWAKTRETLNQFVSMVQADSTPQGLVSVDMTSIDPGWGTKLVSFDLDEITDNSVLEADSEQPRSLRVTITLTLHGWLVLPMAPNRTIYDVLLQTYAVNDTSLTAADIINNPETYPITDSRIVRVADADAQA
jgi:hypothetical protein